MNKEEKEEKKSWYKKRENYLMGFGGVIVFIAISTPFSILYFNNFEYKLTTFVDLGTVGDFFGGTTVGLLSLASLIFVTAAMMMQKEELEIQRRELKRATYEHALTNETMNKQQFENTFFNLINLHHKRVALMDDKFGEPLIEKIIQEFENNIVEYNIYMELCGIDDYDLRLIFESVWKFEKLVKFYEKIENGHLLDVKKSEPMKFTTISKKYKDYIFLNIDNFFPELIVTEEEEEQLKELNDSFIFDYLDFSSIDFLDERVRIVKVIEELITKYDKYICEEGKWFRMISTLNKNNFASNKENEKKVMEDTFSKYKSELKNYYRSFDSLTNLIINIPKEIKDKGLYQNILKAQFTESEYKMISLYNKYIDKNNDELHNSEFFNE